MAAPIETRIGDSMVRLVQTLFCTAAIQAGSTAMARASAVTMGISMALAAEPPPVRKPPTPANSGTLSGRVAAGHGAQRLGDRLRHARADIEFRHDHEQQRHGAGAPGAARRSRPARGRASARASTTTTRPIETSQKPGA